MLLPPAFCSTSKLPARLCLWPALLGMALSIVACQPEQSADTQATPPPVGHFEGSLSPAQQPELRAALDINHPSPGHYEAELTVPAVGTLSFVADTILFANRRLTLRRPARPGHVLTLTQDGDFWRGTLALDSVTMPVILLKRGTPRPRTYRVEKSPGPNGPFWLFAPADTSTPGPALVLLPDSGTSPTAALWADALARNGIVTLLLPAPDTTVSSVGFLENALDVLHYAPGVDTANVGVWAAGTQPLAYVGGLPISRSLRQRRMRPNDARNLHLSFFIAQNAQLDDASRAAFQNMKAERVPVLGLYGGGNARAAAALQRVLGGRRGTVRVYRGTGPDLLVPGDVSPSFGAGLPEDVLQWLPRK
ncbi:alpha/beta hydrolase family protein [Hymenobacter armeniacus]|uniref:Uncharacterized protein n=1 Tax=Hymenobacter armeniacus TaxID=2771358 RepID=A0ABR8JXP5_9BACT|nr:hypothetical protein [Hymenobacter armeniacus]MBD2724729.1 hypothetical protein [Hymenobacter armeniacus]